MDLQPVLGGANFSWGLEVDLTKDKTFFVYLNTFYLQVLVWWAVSKRRRKAELPEWLLLLQLLLLLQQVQRQSGGGETVSSEFKLKDFLKSGIARANQSFWEAGTRGLQGGRSIPGLYGPTQLHPLWLGEHWSSWKNETKIIFTKVNRKDCGLKSGRKSDKSELENGTLLQTASAIGKKEHVRLLLDYGWDSNICRVIRLLSKNLHFGMWHISELLFELKTEIGKQII